MIQQIDLSILLFIQEHLRVTWMNGFWEFITSFGDGGIFWIILSLALMIPKKTRKAGIVAGCSLLLGFLITNVTLKPLVDRVRPYNYSDAIIPLGRIPKESSFPSGHTCASFACAPHLCPHAAEKIRHSACRACDADRTIKAVSGCALSDGCDRRISGGAVFKYACILLLSADGMEKRSQK